MPLVQIKVVEGALSDDEKNRLIGNVTEAVLSIYGENFRPHTWVLIEDVRSGQWGAGGNSVTTEDIKGLRAAPTTR